MVEVMAKVVVEVMAEVVVEVVVKLRQHPREHSRMVARATAGHTTVTRHVDPSLINISGRKHTFFTYYNKFFKTTVTCLLEAFVCDPLPPLIS